MTSSSLLLSSSIAMMMLFYVLLVGVLIHFNEIDALASSSSTSLTTTTRIRNGVTTKQLQDFLSRPTNWPEIVLSSNSVTVIKKPIVLNEAKNEETNPFSFLLNVLPFFQQQEQQQKVGDNDRVVVADNNNDNNDADSSSSLLQQGDTVMEYFGPFDLFQVDWVCSQNEPGKLVVVSSNGVPGMATNCVMDFEIADIINDNDNNNDSITPTPAPTSSTDVQLTLTMEYTPDSPLAVLATPVLILDNWIALNVLLPAAIDPNPLQSFRQLMGVLYGIAGVAHLFDVTVGGSQLFQSTNGLIPPFEELTSGGQLYALLWCATGPLAYVLSVVDTTTTTTDDEKRNRIFDFLNTNQLNVADFGLFLYGFVEVLGAGLVSNGALTDVLVNACAVQALILGVWTYTLRKQENFFVYLDEANRLKNNE